MAVSVQVPDLGEATGDGLVVEWYREDGALVGVGELVCRIENSFAAIEVEAEGEGTLRRHERVRSIESPGAVLALILSAEEVLSASLHAESPEPEPAEPTEVLARWERAEPDDETFKEEAADFNAGHELPEPEFEEALRESIVVPFPRRFAAQHAPAWEEAPGDATEFASALLDNPVRGQTEALAEPGGSIPGLPLWEPDETMVTSAPESSSEPHFARIAEEAAAAAQVLSASIAMQTAEARRLCAVCLREWRGETAPRIEDVLFRAVAFALRDGGLDNAGALVIADAHSDISAAVSQPAGKTLREAVTVRESGGDAPFDEADWVLVSVAALGVSACTPRLDHARRVSFALGAPDGAGEATVTMSFDSLEWSEGSAARLLARIRELFEAPYAMLV